MYNAPHTPASFLSLPTGRPTICCETPNAGFLEFVRDRFDGIWVSSLTQSFAAHLPDNMSLSWENYVEMVARIRTIDQFIPVVVDVDALAGDPAVAAMIASRYAQVGADAIVVEDKNPSAKINSLFATGGKTIPLVTPEEMCKKLAAARHAVKGTRTRIVARTEYLPRNMDTPEKVVEISKRYHRAGAHCIMVHAGKESENLEPLKYVLAELRDAGIPTMIVPQAFTPRAAAGEFDELTGTIILGNVVTSKILELMDNVTREDLLQKPGFGGLLQKSNEITPKSRAMVVLGGKKRPDGQYLLSSGRVQAKLSDAAITNGCSTVVFVNGDPEAHESIRSPEGLNVIHANIEDSMGEVHTLKVGLSEVDFADEILVAYADEQVPTMNLGEATFYGDRFKGSLLVDAASLFSSVESLDPTSYMIDVVTNMSVSRKEVN
ncbi:phosphoenolpyruvate mutase [Vibrio phage Va2]|nr:phosphoenolpyruvate mutase [Vibrio phage Va2]